MGGPVDQQEVPHFLRRLFSDGDIIPLGRLQPFFAWLISRLRTRKIQSQYAAIGGGSPILQWSQLQARETCTILDSISPASAPHRPYVAFRYAHPLTEDVYAKILADGFATRGRAIAFMQYPQYSCSTSGSSVNELYRCQQRLEPSNASAGEPNSRIAWSIIDRWPLHPTFIDAVSRNIVAGLAKFPEDQRSRVTILFSAHSQPMRAVYQGDAYTSEVAATVHATMKHLSLANPYRLCWQSKVGPAPWMGPQTSDVVASFIEKGAPHLLLVPIAFTTDHVETLYELDEELIGDSGHGDTIKRAPSLNDSPLFLRALAEIAKEHIASGEQASAQFVNRCLGCKKPVCGNARLMFARSDS